MKRDYIKIANRYIDDVISGREPACKWVKLACQRQKRDLKRQRSKGWRYRFDTEAAARACAFVELLPHVKGPLARDGKRLVLEPWQVFRRTTVYGWVHKSGRLKGKRRFRVAYDEVPRGNGKALDADTPVPTLQGWKRHGDLMPGDQVFGPDGTPRSVIATSGVYEGPCRTVAFSDGEEVVAHDHHEWRTRRTWFTKRRRGSRSPLPNVETAEIAETIWTTGKRPELVHSIELAEPLVLPTVELAVDPYLLGVWLGDGSSAAGRITAAIADAEIVELIKAAAEEFEVAVYEKGPRGLTIAVYGLSVRLRRLGIFGSGRKAIPREYLRASIVQRRALLQGLMDTDGTISKEGQCEFATTSTALRDGFIELARTLGYKPTLKTCRAMLYGRDCGPSFRIQFWAFEGDPVFRLRRKLNRQKPAPRTRPISRSRTILSADPAGSRLVNCIEVEGGMYLAGRGMVPTHNSAELSASALYAFADKEEGAEVYSAAVTRDQAKIVFGTARRMAMKLPKLRISLGIAVHTNAISQERTASTFKPLASDEDSLDGLNVHFAAIDELHAHKTRAVYDVVETGMGKRDQPLMHVITTAGTNRAGICYEVRSYICKILEGVITDETVFGVIYTIDETDDWQDEASWRKANPNWNVSVDPEHIARMAAKAMQMPSAQPNFLTKHLNVWVNADVAWMDMRVWDKCADYSLKIEDFEGEPCRVALDLATKTDIAAKIRLFSREIEGELHYYAFGTYYLPTAAIEDGRNSQYQGWRTAGLLIETQGDVIDFATIEDEVKEDTTTFTDVEVAYDPWQAANMAQRLQAEGIPVVEFRNTVANFSAPMKEIEALARQGRLHHNGDPILAWMVSNVVCHTDAKDNIYPRKERPENKIDGVVALIMALGRALLTEGEGAFGKDYQLPVWE